ncbi:MAG: hypothetical protein HC840_27705 [Leptolyngbyaceae cyanobacterium RM2_2_4]|nr:hypothetical protein [Leptolyngbyaceae cyanobacterium RM2_2_4]
MATKKEILEAEVLRRQDQLSTIEGATADLQIAKTQQLELDNEHAQSQADIRTELTSVYRESRHYEGKEPKNFYSRMRVKTHPFFQGEADDAGNPYYRLSAIKAGDLGLAPLETGPTHVNGRWTRDRVFAPTEDVPRLPAITALQNYPDHSGEPLPVGWPGSQQNTPGFCTGETPPGSGTNETLCNSNGGTWTDDTPIPDPVWVPSETAPEVLKAAIDPWKRKIEQMLQDTHQDDTATEQLYQDILDEIANLYSLLPAPAVFVRATGNPDPDDWGQTPDPTGALLTSINTLLQYAQTDLPNFLTITRRPFLQSEAERLESEFSLS